MDTRVAGNVNEFEQHREHSRAYLELELARLDIWLGLEQSVDGVSKKDQLLQNEQQLLDFAREHNPALYQLHRSLNLTRSAADLLLCCIGPSLNERFDSLLSEKSGHNSPNITPALLARIFGPPPEWSEFCYESNPLFKMGLLYEDLRPDHLRSQLHRPIYVSRRLLALIHGDRSLSDEVRDILRYEDAGKDEADALPPTLERLASNIHETEERTLLFFHGADGCGKLKAARKICFETSTPLLSLDLRRLPADSKQLSATLMLVQYEIKLANAAVVIPDWHEWGEKPLPDLELILNRVREEARFVVMTSERPFRLSRKIFPIIEVPFEDISYSERTQAWTAHLNGSAATEPTIDVNRLSGMYRFNGGQIQSVVERSKLRRRLLEGDESISEAELVAGCREESSQKLAELSVQVPTRHSWDFLILPEEQKDQLRELCNHMKFKPRVYEDWGYHRRVSAPGLHILFTGPPGTGKTLAASVIANELGLDLYKIDLSTVVSKYIGETEKNLSKIFAEAESSNAILFFDEADSLFGKRSEVNDSHDRYANIQVGYLLQRMEEFPGMTILATNLTENIDEAFARRLHFLVDFPLPDIEQRERIWRVSFPEEAPLDESIDFASLGQQIKVPGGNIRNIALHAAFYAAAEDSKITLERIQRAADREYYKEGRSLIS